MSGSEKGLVRIGVAGLGRSGWNNHAKQVAALNEQFNIVAVMDPNEQRCKEAEAEFGCRSYTDFDSFIADEELEVVTIATPSHLHLNQSIQALKAGKGVVCEKPMTPTLAEADQLIAAAEEIGGLFTVFQNRRYTPDLLKIREVIESGELGKIVKITCRVHKFGRRWDWQTLQEFGGGELNNTASHFVDEVLQLASDGPARVFCHRTIALASGDAEDTCTIVMDIPDSPLLEVEVHAASAYPDEVWYVQGTRGGLKGSMSELRWKTCNLDELPPRPVDRQPTPDRSYNSEQLTWSEEKTWKVPADAVAPQQLFYKDLYETIRNGAPLAVTPQSVRRQIEVLEACRQQSPLPELATS